MKIVYVLCSLCIVLLIYIIYLYLIAYQQVNNTIVHKTVALLSCFEMSIEPHERYTFESMQNTTMFLPKSNHAFNGLCALEIKTDTGIKISRFTQACVVPKASRVSFLNLFSPIAHSFYVFEIIPQSLDHETVLSSFSSASSFNSSISIQSSSVLELCRCSGALGVCESCNCRAF